MNSSVSEKDRTPVDRVSEPEDSLLQSDPYILGVLVHRFHDLDDRNIVRYAQRSPHPLRSFAVDNLNNLLAKFSTNKLTFLFTACIKPIEKSHNILAKFSTGGFYGD